MRKLKFLFTGLILLLMQFAIAQTTEISGRVVDDKGAPLVGATVKEKSGKALVVTNEKGEFTIKVASASADLVISYVGYVEVTVNASKAQLITLLEDNSKLTEVVVTGLASSIKKSNSANSIATLSSKDLTGSTRPPTMDGAMNGKIAGAQITANSGAPGGGFSMRFRGVSSVLGSSEPLFVIDGVIVNNDQFPTGAGTGAFNGATSANAGTQDQAANRIADINPNDIESMNILKGPSAAAIYGSRANAGVVIITTKRGKSGRTAISLSQDLGFGKAIKLLGSSNWTNDKIDTYGGAYGLSVAEAKAALAAANGRTWDYEKIIFGGTPFIRNTNLNISGGNEKIKYYFSGSLQKENGLMAKTGFERRSIRSNVDYRFNNSIDMKITTSYINTYSSRGFTGNDNNGVSILYSLAYIPNFLDFQKRADGTYPEVQPTGQNPFEIIDRAENIERTNRFLNSAELNIQLLKAQKFNVRFSTKGGVDYLLSEPRAYVPEDVQYQSRRPNPGASRYSYNKAFYTYFQSSLTFNTSAVKGFDLTTIATFVRDDQRRDISWIQGTGLLPAQRNPSTAQVRLTESIVQKETVIAYDLSQDINWGNKIIARAGIRADKSTLSGTNVEKWFYFPRASMAINITNFEFWNSSTVFSAIKPRIAYGETSGFPAFNAVYSALGSVNYGGSLGSVSPTVLGNSGLNPERATELEFGIDLGLLNNKITIEATYYKKKIKDFLNPFTLAPATGVTSIAAYPIGDMENKGLEISVNASVLQNKKITINTGVQFWQNRTKITRLIVPPFFVAGSGFGAYGRKRIQLNESPTAWWGFDESNTLVKYKDYQPDYQLSWNTSIKFLNSFDFNMLWHTAQGNHNSSLTRLTKDEGGTTTDWSNPGKGSDPIGVERQATVINNFIFDASYIRLREVSLYYTLPNNLIKKAFKNAIQSIRIGASAQNLITITDYYGYDPEVSNFVTSGVGGGGALVGGVDLGPYPAVKRMFFHINVNF